MYHRAFILGEMTDKKINIVHGGWFFRMQQNNYTNVKRMDDAASFVDTKYTGSF